MIHSQSFIITNGPNEGNRYDGDDVLNDIFALHRIDPWLMMLALCGWIALYRLCHYGLVMYELWAFVVRRS